MTTLNDIKEHMINYMTHFNADGDNDEYYDEYGHCGDGLWNSISDYWENKFNNNKDFEYVVSGKWMSDDLDLDGGRTYIFSNSNVMPLLFDYMVNTLNWNKEKYEDIIYNSLGLTDELEWMFEPPKTEENYWEDKNKASLEKFGISTEDFQLNNNVDDGYVYIPRCVKYPNRLKSILDKTDSLKFLSNSKVDDGLIYEIKSLDCKIPKGYEIIYSLDHYGF